MSNLMLNVRLFGWRLQVVRFSDWRGEFHMGRTPIRLFRATNTGGDNV